MIQIDKNIAPIPNTLENRRRKGIYSISWDGKLYIGSTSLSFRKRWNTHRNELKGNRHNNIYMQRSFNKYGMPDFRILEFVDENIIEREQEYIDTFNPNLNIAPTAGTTKGIRWTDEAKANITGKYTGSKNPNYGKKHSKESLLIISESSKNRIKSVETRKKLSIANKGKVRSAQARKNVSEGLKGRDFSEEHRKNIGKANARREWTEESKAKSGATSRRIAEEKRLSKVDEMNMLLSKFRNGATTKELGELMGTTRSAMGKRLRKHCKHIGEVLNPDILSESQRQAIKTALNHDVSVNALTKIFHVSDSTINRIKTHIVLIVLAYYLPNLF